MQNECLPVSKETCSNHDKTKTTIQISPEQVRELQTTEDFKIKLLLSQDSYLECLQKERCSNLDKTKATIQLGPERGGEFQTKKEFITELLIYHISMKVKKLKIENSLAYGSQAKVAVQKRFQKVT